MRPNNLGHSGSNAIIILNDNGRSYAPTVSLLSDSLKKLRNNPKYLEQQEKIESKSKEPVTISEVLGLSVERAIDAAKAAVREIWDPTSFFEDLGIRYNGPFDGHNIEDLRKRFVMHPVSKDLLLFTSLPKKVEATAQLKMIRLKRLLHMTSGLPNQGATPLLLQRY